MKYFMDADGRYIGAFDGEYPEGFVEVELPPNDARMIYKEGAWALPDGLEDKLSALEAIAELEAKVTERRIREALITGDTSFIKDIDVQISRLRGKL